MQPNISFILYKPAVPGNIGASARALRTMGFKDFRLIAPADHLAEEAKMMAHGSSDILENCTIFDSFDEAVSDLDFIISTTANTNKNAKVDYILSDQLADFISEKGNMIKNLGIVFGTEESGLPGDVLRRSNIGLTIPSAVNYPSLNLSQAVMVIAYELFKMNSTNTEVTKKSVEVKNTVDVNSTMDTNGPLHKDNPKQPEASWKDLQIKTNKILEEIDIKPPSPLYHRIIERMSFLKASDARLVHSITNKLLNHHGRNLLNHHGRD